MVVCVAGIPCVPAICPSFPRLVSTQMNAQFEPSEITGAQPLTWTPERCYFHFPLFPAIVPPPLNRRSLSIPWKCATYRSVRGLVVMHTENVPLPPLLHRPHPNRPFVTYYFRLALNPTSRPPERKFGIYRYGWEAGGALASRFISRRAR